MTNFETVLRFRFLKGQETTYKSVQLSNCLLCVLVGGHGGESISLTSSGVSVIDNLLGTCHIVTITSRNAQMGLQDLQTWE